MLSYTFVSTLPFIIHVQFHIFLLQDTKSFHYGLNFLNQIDIAKPEPSFLECLLVVGGEFVGSLQERHTVSLKLIDLQFEQVVGGLFISELLDVPQLFHEVKVLA